MYIDSHCHLERHYYPDDLDAVITRASEVGLTHLIAVGASRVADGADEALAVAESLAHVYAAVGIHPHDAGQADDAAIAKIDRLLKHPKAVALGEVGLDYYYDNSPREAQQHVFAQFLHMARAHNKPVMLHIRDAHDDCFAMLDDIGLPERTGVVHCFTSGPEHAEQYLRRGMYLSIPGVVTFKNAEPLREAIRITPVDRLLLETDSPYLAPVPFRGKRNEPAFIVKTAEAVGALKGLSGEEVGLATRANAARLFGLPI